MRFALLALLPILLVPAPAVQAAEAEAEPHCTARILADVAAEEAPEQMKSKSNKLFGPVTQIKVNKVSGKMLFCGKGTYCYNSNAFEFITPCRIKHDPEMNDGTYFSFFTR